MEREPEPFGLQKTIAQALANAVVDRMAWGDRVFLTVPTDRGHVVSVGDGRPFHVGMVLLAAAPTDEPDYGTPRILSFFPPHAGYLLGVRALNEPGEYRADLSPAGAPDGGNHDWGQRFGLPLPSTLSVEEVARRYYPSRMPWYVGSEWPMYLGITKIAPRSDFAGVVVMAFDDPTPECREWLAQEWADEIKPELVRRQSNA